MSKPLPMTSSRPYLLRAMYQWILDNDMTPYLLVDASHPDVRVPSQVVKEGKVVLNLAPTAISGLELGNDAVSFLTRFSGVSHSVQVPIGSAQAIYAQENGQGMMFSAEEGNTSGDSRPETATGSGDGQQPHNEQATTNPGKPAKAGHKAPHLRVIK